MPNFCVNKNAQPTGEHEVHNLDAGCDHLPSPENRDELGSFTTCHGAVTKAKETYDKLVTMNYQIEWHEYAMEHSICLEEILKISTFIKSVFK